MTRPTVAMRAHWQFCADRGRPQLPIHAVVSTGGVQPAGYVQAWSVYRAAAEQAVESVGGRAEIVTFYPDGTVAR